MVHKWFLRKGFGRILYGIITVLLGSILLTVNYPYPIIETERLFIASPGYTTYLYLSDIGNVLIMFGATVLLIGFMYLLLTGVLEYRKKSRNAHRSKTR